MKTLSKISIGTNSNDNKFSCKTQDEFQTEDGLHGKELRKHNRERRSC